ncbi:MAG: prepilin-type N-terminal cleavage/methylation domain-containing protein [Gemmatimonadota bacterium]|nr:prepilin-type N-terminal cleavage/methylation domain-containing protein [Gemmatimonadota bacterium]
MRGFSLTELMIVLALLAVIAAMAIPRINTTRYKADAAGYLVRTLLQTAQRNAITRQSNVIVSFDQATNQLRIVQDYNNNDTLNTTDLVKFRKLEEGGQFAKPTWAGVNGITPTDAVIGNALRTVSSMTSIIFRRDGSASTNAEIYVTIRSNVPTEYRAINLIAATGTIELYRWSGAAWIRM